MGIKDNIEQRVRSPRYPSASLQEAEIWARMILSGDGMHPVDRESAVQHLGYSSLNGASATALAALKQYGLIIDAGKGTVRLTTLALDILEPESPERRRVALLEAAFKPELFSALRERFSERLPSEPNLRAHLLRQQFSSAAVKAVIPAYLDTCEYVASIHESERTSSTGRSMAESSTPDHQEDNHMTSHTLPALREEHSIEKLSPVQAARPLIERRMVFDTAEGEVMFFFPQDLSEESVQDIEEWFALVTKRLRRATKH